MSDSAEKKELNEEEMEKVAGGYEVPGLPGAEGVPSGQNCPKCGTEMRIMPTGALLCRECGYNPISIS